MNRSSAQEYAANSCPVLVVTLRQELASFEKFVEIKLRQFQLHGRYTCNDVINECMVRLCIAISRGKSIPCPPGWLRTTALNYIRELSRQEKRTTSYDPSVLSSFPVIEEEEPDQEVQYRFLYESLDQVSSEQRELLELRFLQQMSWNTIAERFRERGEPIQATALRKRGERALMALRRIYLARIKELE